MVVQADFAHRHHFRLLQIPPHLGEPVLRQLPGLLGVYPRGAADVVIPPGQLQGGLAALQIGGHVHNAHHALFRQHPAQQLFPVAVELLAVIVGVGVKYVSQKITSEKPQSGVKVFSQVFFKKLAVGKAEPYGLNRHSREKSARAVVIPGAARKQGPGRFSESGWHRAGTAAIDTLAAWTPHLLTSQRSAP